MQPRAAKDSSEKRTGAIRAGGGRLAGLKRSAKRALANSLYYTGVLNLTRQFESTHMLHPTGAPRLLPLRRFSGSKFGILCYHRVGTGGVPLFSRLNPRVFDAQMNYLKKRYRLVPLNQLCREMQEGYLVEPTLSITFDDGYRDLYNFAFPVLQKYVIPATIYLIGRCMQTGEAPWYDRLFVALENASTSTLEIELDKFRRFALSSQESRLAAAWEIVCYLRSIPDSARQKWCLAFERIICVPEGELENRMLTWDQVRTMREAGVSFGAHTMTHPAVSQLDPVALDQELDFAKKFLEGGLDVAVEDFAYPFGKDSDRSLAAERFLASRGYRSATTTTPGVNLFGTNLFALRRLQIDDDPSMAAFALKVHQLFLQAAPEASPTPSSLLSESIREPSLRMGLTRNPR
jgi:peptidoglycan/xylan/chitin deacetylase (PgdA/CDA1 family)